MSRPDDILAFLISKIHEFQKNQENIENTRVIGRQPSMESQGHGEGTLGMENGGMSNQEGAGSMASGLLDLGRHRQEIGAQSGRAQDAGEAPKQATRPGQKDAAPRHGAVEVRPDLVAPDEVCPDLVAPDAVRPDLVAPDEVRPDLVASDEVRPDLVAADEVRPDLVAPKEVRPDLVAPKEVRPDLVAPLLDQATHPETRPDVPNAWTRPGRTFAQAVKAASDSDLNNLPQPFRIGEKLAIKIPEEAYRAGLEVCQSSLHGRLILSKGDTPPKFAELQQKLQALWTYIGKWSMIILGKGYFEFKFESKDDMAKICAKTTWGLKPGILKLFMWTPDFNPQNQRLSQAQCWIRIYDLPQEYWHHVSLLSIAKCIGTPIALDQATSKRSFGIYARVLVEIDLKHKPPEELIIEREGFSFTVNIDYENLPDFCTHCLSIGHVLSVCRKLQAKSQTKDDANIPKGPPVNQGLADQPAKQNIDVEPETLSDQSTQGTRHLSPEHLTEPEAPPGHASPRHAQTPPRLSVQNSPANNQQPKQLTDAPSGHLSPRRPAPDLTRPPAFSHAQPAYMPRQPDQSTGLLSAQHSGASLGRSIPDQNPPENMNIHVSESQNQVETLTDTNRVILPLSEIHQIEADLDQVIIQNYREMTNQAAAHDTRLLAKYWGDEVSDQEEAFTPVVTKKTRNKNKLTMERTHNTRQRRRLMR